MFCHFTILFLALYFSIVFVFSVIINRATSCLLITSVVSWYFFFSVTHFVSATLLLLLHIYSLLNSNSNSLASLIISLKFIVLPLVSIQIICIYSGQHFIVKLHLHQSISLSGNRNTFAHYNMKRNNIYHGQANWTNYWIYLHVYYPHIVGT